MCKKSQIVSILENFLDVGYDHALINVDAKLNISYLKLYLKYIDKIVFDLKTYISSISIAKKNILVILDEYYDLSTIKTFYNSNLWTKCYIYEYLLRGYVYKVPKLPNFFILVPIIWSKGGVA